MNRDIAFVLSQAEVARLNDATNNSLYDMGFNDGKAEREPHSDLRNDSTYQGGYQDGQNERLTEVETERYNADRNTRIAANCAGEMPYGC
jgi:hypothetical protein